MSLQNISKSAVRVGKNYLKGYTDTQIKAREATSNDPWGPSGAQMAELAQLSYNQTDFVEMMEILDKRLNDKGKNWRHVFKALTVLDYLLHSGSQNVWMYFHDNIYIVKTLKEFQYVDDSDRDQGLNVRQKAKEITALLLDESRMGDMRRKRTEMARTQNGDYSDDIGRRRRANANREAEDKELQRALEESRRMAEEDEARRKANKDDDDNLAKALAMSREEEEERRKAAEREAAKKDSLIDLDGGDGGYGVQPQFTGYNPYLQFQPTGYNPFFQVQMQQQEMMQQQYMQQEYQRQLQMQQAAQQYQQMMMLQQQPLQPQQTSFGSNNPWLTAESSTAPPTPMPEPAPAPAPEPAPATDTLISLDEPPAPAPAPAPVPSGPPRVKTSNAHPELDRLLASGDGVDTFGNTGDMRMGHNAQTWAYIKQQRTGVGASANPTGNPFL